MKKYGNLLNTIADDLGIKKGIKETETEFKCRILYSIFARMGYASLWDKDDEGSVTILHFKGRIKAIIQSYLEMYPEMKRELAFSDEIVEELYNIYLRAGYIYHTQYRVFYAKKSCSQHNNILFTRGYPLGEKQLISGAGNYMRIEVTQGNALKSENIFNLGLENPAIRWKKLIHKAVWTERNIETKAEYLNINLLRIKSYWINTPIKDGCEYILRTGFTGKFLYYLYKFDNEKMMISQLPEWMCVNGEYLNLTNACLMFYNKLPTSFYVMDGNIVRLSVGYLYPPPENNYLKLYSWPASLLDIKNSNFSRILDKEIFFCIKEIFEKEGYEFKEG